MGGPDMLDSCSSPLNFGTPKCSLHGNEYAELKRTLKQMGAMERQVPFYARKIGLTFVLLILSLSFLAVVGNVWLQLLDAVFLAFVFGQWSFIVHDAGHHQIFSAAWKNNLVGLLHANLLVGASFSGWVRKHNQHHANPNQSGLDPDVVAAGLAFTAEQARDKPRLVRPIVRSQAYLCFPLFLLEAVVLRVVSLQFLFQNKVRHRPAELLLILAHYALYFGGLFYLLGLSRAILFITVHQAFYGLYMGSVFIPNHTGMPIVDKDTELSFLQQQVLTARNIRAHPVTDFWCGALNYQIEHHLFPTIARNKMREVQKTVRAFCQAHSIPYRETCLLQSYREVLQHLRQVSLSLREGNCDPIPNHLPKT